MHAPRPRASTRPRNRLQFAPVAFILALLIPGSGVAQTASCHPLAFQPVVGAEWDDDTAYEMTVRDLGGGRLRITVVGDILAVDGRRYASLVRTVDKAPGNVVEVVLDGREVRLLEPLALQSASLRIYARRFAIEGAGLVALTRAPGSTADGVYIDAAEVDLTKALPLPLQVAVMQGSARTFRLRSRVLVTSSGKLTGDAASRWLWRHSTNFDGALPAAPPPGWNVTVSEAGEIQAVDAMRQVASWPAYTAYKLRKHHAFAPFDEGRKSRLSSRIDEVRPLIESLQRSDVLMDINGLTALMRQNVDRRGFGPAHVPSEDLVVAKARLRTSIGAASTQLPRLRTLIASAHGVPTLDEAALADSRARIRALVDAHARRRAEIGDAFTDLSVLEARAVETSKEIEYQREESRKRLEALKQNQKDLANIRAATTVLAIGASFVGTPAAGAAIATGVGVVGDFVYANNAGTPISVETLVTIGEKNTELYKRIKAARAAWDEHSADLGVAKDVFDGKSITLKNAKKPLTRTDAVKIAGESATEFAEKVKDVVDGLGAIPTPSSVSLNQVENENAGLWQALAKQADIQRGVSEATARLAQLQTALVADEAALAETRLVEQVLVELRPVNDQEILRWKTAALQLWSRELQRLYQDAMDLRRSLFFETWKTPVLPPEVLAYPEEFTAYLSAGRYSPEAPNATSPRALTEAHLDVEIAKHLAVLGTIANAIDEAWQTYLAERAAGAQPFFDQHDFSVREGAPASGRLFLDQLNAQIRQQVAYRAMRGSARFPLLVPLTMTPPPTDLPERLLQAGVTNVKFKDPQSLVGKTVAFDITYRLAGELRRFGQCAYVDLGVPGGATTATRRDQARELRSVRSEAEQPMTFENLRQSRAAPPARTFYFLSVTIGGSEQDTNWSNVPVVESLTFWRRIVQ
jgi:hypothetical protein